MKNLTWSCLVGQEKRTLLKKWNSKDHSADHRWLRSDDDARKECYTSLYIHRKFSVKAATIEGVTLIIKKAHNVLIHKDDTKFDVIEYDRPYYLNTFTDYTVSDKSDAIYDCE
ncbi:hypothetical protein HOLleu_04800 [Holothuria leucospilota]|uniref:Uncharacterized protein n=1 Tax=Holothuria leucospilota TaxID=206669 RepID=A0A9Q1CJ03_HOLLE|nr:hypothetical protein HOLleu_04800 [Holothuria leucospilota]